MEEPDTMELATEDHDGVGAKSCILQDNALESSTPAVSGPIYSRKSDETFAGNQRHAGVEMPEFHDHVTESGVHKEVLANCTGAIEPHSTANLYLDNGNLSNTMYEFDRSTVTPAGQPLSVEPTIGFSHAITEGIDGVINAGTNANSLAQFDSSLLVKDFAAGLARAGIPPMLPHHTPRPAASSSPDALGASLTSLRDMENPPPVPVSILDYQECTANAPQLPYLPLEQVKSAYANQQIPNQPQYPKVQVIMQSTHIPATSTHPLYPPAAPSTSSTLYVHSASSSQTAYDQFCQTKLPLERELLHHDKQLTSDPEHSPRNYTIPSHTEEITNHPEISTGTRNQSSSRVPTTRMRKRSLQPENLRLSPYHDSQPTHPRCKDAKRTQKLLQSVKLGQAGNSPHEIASDNDASASEEDTLIPLGGYRFHRAQTVALGSLDFNVKRKRNESHSKHDSPRRNKLARLDHPSEMNATPSRTGNSTGPPAWYRDGNCAESLVRDSTSDGAQRKPRQSVISQPSPLGHSLYPIIIHDGHESNTSHLYRRHSKEAHVLASPISSVSSGISKADAKGRLREGRQQIAQNAYDDNDYLFCKKPVPNPNAAAFSNKDLAHKRVGSDASLNTHQPIKMISTDGAQYHDKHETIYISSGSEDTGPLPPVIKSVPIRKRVLPLGATRTRRAVSRTRTPGRRTRAATPRLPASPKKDVKSFRQADTMALEVSEEEMRQKRAAELIIEKEVEAVQHAEDLQLFGEVVPDDEEKKRLKIEDERTAAKAAKEARQLQEFFRHEKQHAVEMEKQRQAAEVAEARKLQKERDEFRKKAIRDVEREKNLAAEEMQREEKRQAAIDKIEADRLKAIAEAEERARAKKEAEEKARSVQADRNDMDALRAKQEIARKQAASLNSAKTQCNQDQQSEDIDSLFIPDFANKQHETDFSVRRPRASSVRPSSAAHLFATSRPCDLEGTYRAERDAIENLKVDMARQNQEQMRKRQEKDDLAATQPKKPQSIAESPGVLLSARTGTSRKERIAARKSCASTIATSNNAKCLPAKPPGHKSFVTTVNPFVDDDSEDEISVPTLEMASGAALRTQRQKALQRQTISNPSSSFNSVNTSFQSTKSAPAMTGKATESDIKTTSKYTSRVNIISDAERQCIERRLTANKKSKKTARTEAQKIARKQQDDKKARERKTQQLLDEAKASGIELTEDMLDVQLEAYMTKRERENQRRTESRHRIESMAASKSNALTLGSIRAQASFHSAKVEYAKKDIEIYDTSQNRARKATNTAAKERRNVLSDGRGSRFAQAAQQKTIAHLQESDSEESVEDPDDEIPLMIDDQAFNGSDPESVEDEDEHELRQVVTNAIKPHEHDIHSSDPLSENFSLCNDFPRKDPPTAHDETEKLHEPTTPGQIYVYTIFEQFDREGDPVDGEPQHVETFTYREDANRYARQRLLNWRDKYDVQCPSFTEKYDDNKLYSGRVWCNRSETESIYMKVRRFVQASAELPNSDTLVIRPRLPEKSWMLKRITKTVIDGPVDGESQKSSSSKILEQEMIEDGFVYSNLPDANRAARQKAFEFLKPKKPTIDYVERHENGWGELLRGAEIECTEQGKPFFADMDVDDDNLQWMKPITNITFEVELYLMKGPLN